MKQAIYVMFLVTLILSSRTEAGTSNRRADSLAFRIHLDKTEYLLGEDVFLHIFVMNLTDDTLHTVMPDYYIRTVDVHVVNDSGSELMYSGGMNLPRRICQQTLLLPRDTLLGIFDLSYCYDQRSITGDTDIVGLVLGGYTVEAVYLDRMRSNTLHFSVEKPTGAEADAFDLFRAVRVSHRFYRLGDMQSNIEVLLQRFPQSAYAAQALDLMQGAYSNYRNYDVQKIIECSKRLISEYPNDPRCQQVLSRILDKQTVAENRAYLQSIVKTKSGTWAARLARIRLVRPSLEEISVDGLKRRFK